MVLSKSCGGTSFLEVSVAGSSARLAVSCVSLATSEVALREYMADARPDP